MTAISDEELERKMRQKLFPTGAVTARRGLASMSETERCIAEKLVGRDNAERLQKHDGVGRFRPAPVIVHYEWWATKADHYSRSSYHIARIENGRQIPHWQGFDKCDLDKEISRLKATGSTVRRFMLAGECGELEQKKAKPSERKKTLGELAKFKVGGDA